MDSFNAEERRHQYNGSSASGRDLTLVTQIDPLLNLRQRPKLAKSSWRFNQYIYSKKSFRNLCIATLLSTLRLRMTLTLSRATRLKDRKSLCLWTVLSIQINFSQIFTHKLCTFTLSPDRGRTLTITGCFLNGPIPQNHMMLMVPLTLFVTGDGSNKIERTHRDQEVDHQVQIYRH